ncbi:hypothetical protein D1872_243820 [compost metagenome]
MVCILIPEYPCGKRAADLFVKTVKFLEIFYATNLERCEQGIPIPTMIRICFTIELLLILHRLNIIAQEIEHLLLWGRSRLERP